MRRITGVVLAVATAACGGAPEARQYQVHGQIVSFDSERKEVVVDHEDIQGFMPAMVMPYKVQDIALLEGKTPGDLVDATLVVEEVNAYLTTLTKTGHAPLRTSATGPAITDADMVQIGDVVPDALLVDQSGKALSMQSLRGHRVALTFIYTRCPIPDFCPLMDRHFVDTQVDIAKSPDLADVRLVSVTIDPEYDTPEILAEHAKALGANPQRWSFATGEPGEVMTFAKRFGVIAEPDATSATLVHNLRTLVIDPEGRLVTAYSGNMWSPDELVADLKAAPAPQR